MDTRQIHSFFNLAKFWIWTIDFVYEKTIQDFMTNMLSLISISSSEMAISNISKSFNMNNLPGQQLDTTNFQSKQRHLLLLLSEYQNITRQNFAIHSSKLQYCACSNVAKAYVFRSTRFTISVFPL